MHAAAGTPQLTLFAVNAVVAPGNPRAKIRWHRALLLGGVIATAQAAASDLDKTSTFDPSLPDLGISIYDTPDPVPSGQIAYLNVHIRNQGGGTAPGPHTYTIDLPPQLEYLAGGSPTWSCSAVAQQVTCDSDEEVGPGVSLPGVSISARTSGPITTVVVRARVDYGADPNISNNEASTSITIAGPVPVSARDRYSVQTGQTLTVARPGVLGNDVSGPESTLTVDMFFDPDRGALQLHPDGSFSYVPAAAFIGTDTFFYRATDGTSQSGLTAVDVEVVAAGSGAAPLANDDHYDAIADRALDVAGPGVLANDIDAENDVLLAALVLAPAHGNIELGSDGGLHYMPDDGFVGEDSFTYTASDGVALSSAATVTLTVGASGSGGTAPTAFDDEFAVPPDRTLAISEPGVLANDADADDDLLSVRLVAAPEHGVLGIGSDGSFTYRPDPSFLGSDRFQYVASDGVLESAVATANIAVANIDLAVAKSNGVDGLGDGQPVVYAVEVRNEGASTAVGARVTDLLPLQLVDAQWTCSAIGTDCPQSEGTGSPEIVADFPPGSQLILQISARVEAGSATSVTNTATVALAANEVDAVPDNNQATDVDALLPDGVFRDGFERLGLKRFEETLPAYRKRTCPAAQ